MKRKVVQHGPSTLTISIPKEWATTHKIEKGSELEIDTAGRSLEISPCEELELPPKTIDARGKYALIPKLIGAAYKLGYERLIITYTTPQELERIHRMIDTRYIGFEVIEEKRGEVHVRSITRAGKEEFKTLFRRMFYFLLNISEESISAAKEHDITALNALTVRDVSVDKLANFCRRTVQKHGQKEYRSDICLYHIIEQLEKIGDLYKKLHTHLANGKKLTDDEIALYEATHEQLKRFDKLFFSYNDTLAHTFILEDAALQETAHIVEKKPHTPSLHLIKSIARELYNLLSPTMMLHI